MLVGISAVLNCVNRNPRRHKIQACVALFILFYRAHLLVELKELKAKVDNIMLGVVLWSDLSDRKAVIWCEDQGDLAYLNGPDAALTNGEFFDAGDLVQFDVETSQTTRIANNPRLVIHKAGQSLPVALKTSSEAAQSSTEGAQIIQFESFRRRERNTIP